jgi:site-specific DNA recombinase
MVTSIQAIGYVRRSTNRQEESLEQQREKLEAFAQARGWQLAQVYADDAISGSQMQRPGLEALIAHAERSSEVGYVLAWERNRLARPKDPVDGLLLERKLLQAGKRVFYVATGQEAERSFTAGLVGYVEHYQNGDYLRKLSRDAMRGMIARAKRGFWPCGTIPLGYDRLCLGADGSPKRIVRAMADGSQLLLHPETQQVIERIADGVRYQKPDHEFATLIPSEPACVHAIQQVFVDYLAGVPFRILRDTLNQQGMRSTSGDVFTIATLHTMLENPAYKGTLTFNRRTRSKWHRYTQGKSIERQDEGDEYRHPDDWIIVENAWPAIIEPTLFDQVQAKLKTASQARLHVTGYAAKSDFLLSNLCTCGVCGGRLMGLARKVKRKNSSARVYRRYVCGVHHKGDHGRCPTRYAVPADVAEGKVLEYIKADLEHLKGDADLHRYVQEELQKVCGSQIDSQKALKARLADLDGQIVKLTTHLSVLDLQTATTLRLYAKAKALADERQQVQSQLDAQGAGVPELLKPEEIARRAEEELSNLDRLLKGGSVEEKRELVRTYVKAMKVHPGKEEMEIDFLPALFTRIGTGVCVWLALSDNSGLDSKRSRR